MDRPYALSPNGIMGVIPPVQSGAPMTPLQPHPGHSQSYSWKRGHSSVNAVSFAFIATAVLISVFLIIAVFETYLRRPSLRPNSIHDRNLDVGEPPATEFSVKREDAIFDGTTRISVLMPGQTLPTFIAKLAPIPSSHEETFWPAHDHVSTASCSLDSGSVLNLPMKSEHEPNSTVLV